MPGLSFIYDFDERVNEYDDYIHQSLNNLLHTNDFKKEILVKNNFYQLAFTGYNSYPKHLFENENYLFLVEGKIYNLNLPQIEKQLINYAAELFSFDGKSKDKIADWLRQLDGDFLICAVNKKTKSLVFFNDALGRLPFYTYREGSRVFVTRELRFISNLSEEKDFDKYAIAECLLFGYPLGEKTFYKNIKRVPPASIINLNLKDKTFEINSVIEFDLSKKFSNGKNLNEFSDELVRLFLQSCKDRITNNSTNVLSLSGGLDSRAIAGALLKINAKFTAATYRGYKEFADKDAQLAKEVAALLKIDWKLFDINTPEGKDHIELLKNKNGMNTLASTFLLSFYKGLRDYYGSDMIYITGDGGDKVFPDHRPALNISSLESLVDYTISNKHYFTLKKVSSLLDIEEEKIKEDIISHFAGYPEKEMADKYVKFLIAERGIKWLFEAEDRNRFYFWSLTPFYSVPFFFYAMGIPDKYKAGHKLYGEFLNKLLPGMQNIKNALWNVPVNPDNAGFKAFLFMKDKVYPMLPGKIKRTLRMKINKTRMVNIAKNENLKILLDSLADSPAVNKVFNRNELLNTTLMNKAEFFNLITILLALEDYRFHKTSLEKFIDTELI